MTDISGTLSICRRAGKLTGGADEVKSAVLRHEARLVILSSDLSENTRRDIARLCEREGVKRADIDYTMDDVSDAVGKRWGILAITDSGFAKSVLKKLSEN